LRRIFLGVTLRQILQLARMGASSSVPKRPPYGFIGRFQGFNGKNTEPSELALGLFESYRKNKQTQKKMSEILVGLFEQSGSFAEAKRRIGYLEELEVWEPSYATRISSAAETNIQIEQSWAVPARVASLAKKWSTT
jgi:hypothetical protein